MRMGSRGHGGKQSRRTAVLHPLTGLLEVWGAAVQQADPLQIESAASNGVDSRPETLSLHGLNVPLASPGG